MSNIFKLCPTDFPRGAKNFLGGLRPPAYGAASQHCCGKAMDGKWPYMLFFELYKIMVNKVTFVGFRGNDRPNPRGSDPAPDVGLCRRILTKRHLV